MNASLSGSRGAKRMGPAAAIGGLLLAAAVAALPLIAPSPTCRVGTAMRRACGCASATGCRACSCTCQGDRRLGDRLGGRGEGHLLQPLDYPHHH